MERTDSSRLDEETFDFDLSMSDTSQKSIECHDGVIKEEDEVFFGPVGHKEKCIAKAVQDEEHSYVKPLSPLTAAEMVLLFKEAQTVAYHLKRLGTPQRVSKSSTNSTISDLGASPITLLGTPCTHGTKRKLDSPILSDPVSPKLKVKSFRLDSPEIKESLEEPVACVESCSDTSIIEKPSEENSKQANKNLKQPNRSNGSGKPPGRGSLQRSASLRLPKSKLPGGSRSAVEVSKDTSDIPVSESGRVRHASAFAGNLPRSNLPHRTSLVKPTQNTVSSSIPPTAPAPPTKMNKLQRIKELVKPSFLQKKFFGNSAKQVDVLPKGPMKATVPMKKVSTEETQPVRGPGKGLQRSHSSVGSSTNSTPGRASSLTRRKSISVAPITPSKQDKSLQPKRLLSSPAHSATGHGLSQSGSCSPASSTRSKRKSCLPTPGRPALSSVSSVDSEISPPKACRSLCKPALNKENASSSKISPASRLISKLKPLRLIDKHRLNSK